MDWWLWVVVVGVGLQCLVEVVEVKVVEEVDCGGSEDEVLVGWEADRAACAYCGGELFASDRKCNNCGARPRRAAATT